MANPDVAGGQTVTLVTGDRVRVQNGQYRVEPGPGRERMVFVQQRAGGREHLVPADALPLINAGRVDLRLFDIAGLLELGYGDQELSELPLLVRPGNDVGMAARRAGPGVRLVHDLPVLNTQAVDVAKSSASDFWSTMIGTPAGATGGPARNTANAPVSRVWLDGRRQISLDRSVPQIGAPRAWQAGHSGRGVKVAVLDTGIDATHPDFAGRLARIRNFTGAPDADDLIGHGTHVASIIAGSGSAAGGRFKGVAPEATLLIGKVCETEECPESAILAGMEWAASNGAAVVNLSLGDADRTELDPLKEAVETLTAQYGTLFVIAAGNQGPGDRSISSPASADSALAVGAVDAHDELAYFSSRGPRLAGGAIKPELTAPGVEIVAARAKSSVPDEPVGRAYARMSGTSMATPHVAGAAVLLAQQHPGWHATELKAALMGTAKPDPKLGLNDQGAGRVDVAAATAQSIRMDPPTLALGIAPWPHHDDQPMTRTVTYHNSGNTPATLRLAVQVTGPDRTAAPAGMFEVRPTTLTVPAGGSATATVTANTRLPGPDGVYEGQVLATGAAGTLRTPLVIDREPESYELKLTHLDRVGASSRSYFTFLDGVSAPGTTWLYEPDGTTSVRLPAGQYHLASVIFTEDAADESATLLTQPELNLNSDTNIVLDARTGRRSTVTVPRPGAQPFLSVLGYYRKLPHGDLNTASLFTLGGLAPLFSAQLGPALPADQMRGRLISIWADPGADGYIGDGSHLYNLAWFPPGQVPSGVTHRVRSDELAAVRAVHRTSRPGSTADKVITASRPDYVEVVNAGTMLPLPATRTEYYNTDDGVRWSAELRSETGQVSAPTAYRPGQQTEVWQTPVFGPSFPESPFSGTWMSHQDDRLWLAPPLFGDRDPRHAGKADLRASSAVLYRNGKRVPETEDGDYSVPPGDAGYRYETEAIRSEGELSTRVQAVWTFRSGGPGHRTQLPVMAVRYSPQLDGRDAAPVGEFRIPVTVQRQVGAAPSAVRTLTVEVSYDDGRTWRPAQLNGGGGSWTATVVHPARAGYVSLRANAVDQAGNTVRQSIIHAYRLKG